MKKFLLLVLTLAVIPVAGFAAQRVVLLEVGTGTWCQYCPGAAMGADDLEEAYGDSIAVIENHNGDIFAYTYSNTRNAFYGISGYPTAIFDGCVQYVGGSTSQSLFSTYNPLFQQRLAIPSPLVINLEKTYNSSTHSGTVKATIVNEGTTTITGKAHIVITELVVPYSWRGLPSCDFVNRDMRPDANGTPVEIDGGDSVVVEQTFNINPSWASTTNEVTNYEIVCFVQNTNTGYPADVYQAAKTGIVPPLSAIIEKTEIKSVDGKLHPGETSTFLVTLLNNGEDSWETLEGVLSTEDENIKISDSLGTWEAAAPGEQITNTDDPFKIKLNLGQPDGYEPELNLTITDDMGRNLEVVGFVPTKPGITESALAGFSLSISSVVKGHTVAAINVPSSVSGTVDLYDASGRQVKNLYTGRLSSGTNLLPVSLEDVPTGTYFVKLRAGDQTSLKKLVVID